MHGEIFDVKGIEFPTYIIAKLNGDRSSVMVNYFKNISLGHSTLLNINCATSNAPKYENIYSQLKSRSE